MQNAPWAKKFYGSAAWQKCRQDYIQFRRGLCEECLRRGVITPGVEVHHLQRITSENINDASVTLNFDNLELLCKECHYEAHRSKERYSVSRDGKVKGRDAKVR